MALEPGEALAFAAGGPEATGSRSAAFHWSVQESGGGTVDTQGNYSTPQNQGTFHVVAASSTDTLQKASVQVDVRWRGIRIRITPSTTTLSTGQSTTFTAIVRGTQPGQSTAVEWSVKEGASGGTIDASGNYKAPANPGTFHVVATSVADPTKSTSATVTVTADQGIAVAVTPSNASMRAQGKLSFKATVIGVTGGQSSGVTWSVQEGASGGSVDTSGNYTAPATGGTDHVVAASIADPSKIAIATVTVTAAPPIGVSISPGTTSVMAGEATTFSATVTGGSGGQSTDVTWSVQEGASGGSIDGSGRYTAPGAAGTYHVVATSVADPSQSATAAVTVTAAPNIVVSISPSSASTQAGGTLNFTASVTGVDAGQSTAVSWSIQEGSAGGTINGSGLYTAPSSAGTFHVIATSVADNNEFALATVTVTPASAPPPPTSGLLPSDRMTVWNPGLNAVGGIPSGAWPICATLSPSGGDDAAPIQSALDSCGTNKVVKLNPGTFRISRSVRIPSNVVLRGSGGPGTGAGQTEILQTGNQPNVQFEPGFGGFTQITDLATDAVKDSNSVTLTQARNLTPGELVMIDELVDPSLIDWGYQDQGAGGANRGWFMRGPNNQGEPQGRPTGQMMEIASVNGATVTFTTPFHITFKVSQKAQLVRLGSDNSGNGAVVPAIRNAGVEDLLLSAGVGGDNGANVWMHWCAYCWIRNIEGDRSNGSSVAMTGTFRSVLRDSYLHSTVDPNPGGGGYGLSINWHAADNLVENNISWNFNKVMVMRASGGGNVIGYNYMDDGWISYIPSFVEVGMSASHMAGPMYELFEGNQSFNFDGDSTHGNANYITVFRNNFTALRRKASPLDTVTYNSAGSLLVYEDVQNRRAIGLMGTHRYYTFIGNVLGMPGQTVITPRSQNTGNGGPFDYGTGVTDSPWLNHVTPMWQLGWDPTFTKPQDQSVISTAIRDGNFDYVTNQVHWDRAAQALPDSLYLSGKPAFFGSNTWPWVDALGGTKTFALPARQRFDVLHP